MPVRVPAGRHLEDAGDAEVGHRLHAQVPAHRAGDLADDPRAGPRGRRGRPGRRGWRSAGCAGRASRPSGPAWPGAPTAGAMCSVWKAPATLSGISRALAGGSSASAWSCSMVPAATIWPGPLSLAAVRPVLLEGREHLVAVAAEDGGHAGRRGRGGVGHRLAALADQHHRLLGGDHPGAGGGGELADAVAGDRADLAEGVGRVREERERGDQPGGDQQRLGDRRCRGSSRRRPRCRSGRGRARRRSRATRSRSANVGSSSQGVRKPGVWAPWPGATMTSTGPALPGPEARTPVGRARNSPDRSL